MAERIKDENYEGHQLALVRNKLQKDKVKLWLPPYFQNGSACNEPLRELGQKYAVALELDQTVLEDLLRTLQNHALEKLASREKFQASGLATLRVKVISDHQNTQETVEIPLVSKGQDLRARIGLLVNTDHPERVKIISHGKVIKDELSLAGQGVGNSDLLLAFISSSENDRQAEENILREVDAIKNDANLLASKDDDHSDYLNITDQNGKLIKLPREEKKSLVIAMALHEKGRANVKRNDYSFALTLLHEADNMFNQCRSELLAVVDNYALLNLDIAWCYLLLGSAADIPDAVVRLDRCQKCLEKSYGPNLERLLQLKGTTGTEAVLFVRLHLLQGVVAFHQGRREDALRLFQQTQQEIANSTVNDDDLSELIALGFSAAEARLGLRATGNRLSDACTFLHQRREQREKIHREEREERKRRKEREKWGKTADGQWVNLGFHRTMISMGFPASAAAEALKQTNNNITLAIENLQQNPHLFFKEDNPPVDEEKVAQILSLGFAMDSAEKALKKHRGDITNAVEDLAANMGNIVDDSSMESPGTSSEESESKRRREEEESAAYERLATDLPQAEDDYLDVALELETSYLQQYLAYFR